MDDKLKLVTEKLSQRVQGKPAFGHTVKLVLTDIGTLYIDGTGSVNVVSNDAKTDADLVLTTTHDVMQDLDQRKLDAFSAYMQGKLSIEGDQSIALAFASLIES